MADKNIEIIKVIQQTGKVPNNIPLTKITTKKMKKCPYKIDDHILTIDYWEL